MTKPKTRKPRRQHSEIENISIFGAHGRMGPIGLRLYASRFLSAANNVELDPEKKFTPVKAFLVCRALELSLKAFLSIKGYRLTKLAGGEYGHDLENLLIEAERHGLNDLLALPADQRSEILAASTYYLEKVFEYPAVAEALEGYPGFPNVVVLAFAAEALVSALAKPCEDA